MYNDEAINTSQLVLRLNGCNCFIFVFPCCRVLSGSQSMGLKLPCGRISHLQPKRESRTSQLQLSFNICIFPSHSPRGINLHGRWGLGELETSRYCVTINNSVSFFVEVCCRLHPYNSFRAGQQQLSNKSNSQST